MLARSLIALALFATAFAGECEDAGGSCKRSCNGGVWDFGLECNNARRMCCLTEDSEVVTAAPTPVSDIDISAIPGQANCGVTFGRRIVNGAEAREHEWPWQISLFKKDYSMHVCGGTLISDRYVVTAAHCVAGNGWEDPAGFLVTLGEHDLGQRSGNEITRGVEEIIRHENYVDRAPWPNDIALLKLDAPVTVGTRHVNTACLPQSNYQFSNSDECWITGWGDSKGTAGNEEILQEVRADIRTNQDCANAWGGNSIRDSMICNADGSSGSCQGDSGGPMQCTHSNSGRYHLVGVVSWGSSDCTTRGLPGIYTRVTSYVNWIANKVMQ